MPKLEHLVIRGVALVDQGANQHAKVLISKRAGGDMADEQKLADLEKQLAEATAKAEAATKELAELKGTGILTSDLDTLKRQNADVEKKLAAEKVELQKQLEERTKEAAEAVAEVAKIRSMRRREGFLKRAHELAHLPGAAADDFGETLDVIEAGLHAIAPETATKHFEKLNRLLTAWNVALEKSAVFESIGVSGDMPFRGALAQIKMLAKEAQLADPKLTEAQAFDKALSANPALYRKYLAEKES